MGGPSNQGESYDDGDPGIGWRSALGFTTDVDALKFIGDVIAGQHVIAKGDFAAVVTGPPVAKSYAFRGSVTVGHTIPFGGGISFDESLATVTDDPGFVLLPGAPEKQWSVSAGHDIAANATHAWATVHVEFSDVTWNPLAQNHTIDGNWLPDLNLLDPTGWVKIKKPVSP